MKTISIVQDRSLINSIRLIVTFTFLMVISAYVRIPLFFTPVPFTLQTLVLYLSLSILKKKACFPQLLYVLLGVGGFSVFANGGAGFLYLLGPTGGYIMGFLAAAFIFPYLLPKENSFFKNFLFFSLAAAVIYCFGLAWLIFFHHFSVPAALAAGFYPFVPAAIVKIAAASIFSSNRGQL